MTKPNQHNHFISWIGFITSMVVLSFKFFIFELPPVGRLVADTCMGLL
jgi:desulfoferrodoxin (superoxide reductase-like protein)